MVKNSGLAFEKLIYDNFSRCDTVTIFKLQADLKEVEADFIVLRNGVSMLLECKVAESNAIHRSNFSSKQLDTAEFVNIDKTHRRSIVAIGFTKIQKVIFISIQTLLMLFKVSNTVKYSTLINFGVVKLLRTQVNDYIGDLYDI